MTTTLDFTPIASARELAHKSELALETISNLGAEIPEDLTHAINTARSDAAQSAQSLSRPTFQLVTVGTTSAGKSTLLNALLGRELCPMDTDEMSAGLLSIENGEHWTLETDHTAPPNFIEPTEALIHDYLKEQMRAAVDLRKRGESKDSRPFARYRISGPLRTDLESHPFRKTFNGRIGLKVYDLPGLRTIDDRENHEIITSTVSLAFPIVITDYTKLYDREQRKKLFEEVEESLRGLSAPESRVLFLLNKVDSRTVTDHPVSTYLEDIKKDLGKHLNFKTIDLIPFSGYQMLGAALAELQLESNSVGLSKKSLKLLQASVAFVKNASVTELAEDRKARKQLRRKLGEVEEILEDLLDGDAQDLSSEEQDQLLWLIEESLRHAGENRLWEALLDRMNSHMAPLIIDPASRKLRGSLGKVWQLLDAFLTTRVAKTREEVDSRREELAGVRSALEERLQAKRNELTENIRQLPNLLLSSVSSDAEYDKELLELMRVMGFSRESHPRLLEIRATMAEFVMILKSEVLNPVTDTMADYKSGREISACLNNRSSERLQYDLSDAWNELRACKYYTATVAKSGRHETIDESEFDKGAYRTVRSCYNDLFNVLRSVLTLEGDKFLMVQSSSLKDELQDWTEKIGTKTWSIVVKYISETVGSSLLTPDLTAASLSISSPSPPKGMFEVAVPEVATKSKRMTVQTVYKNKRIVEENSCSENTVTFEKVPQQRSYAVPTVKISLPSADEMNQKIREKLVSKTAEFWLSYIGWLEKALNTALDQVYIFAEAALSAADAGLDARLRELEADAEARVDQWEARRENVQILRQLQDSLGQLAGEVRS